MPTPRHTYGVVAKTNPFFFLKDHQMMAFDVLAEGNSFNGLYNKRPVSPYKITSGEGEQRREKKKIRNEPTTLVALLRHPCEHNHIPCLMGHGGMAESCSEAAALASNRRPGPPPSAFRPCQRSHAARQPRLPESTNDFTVVSSRR
jgi:hypothetical protein